LPARRFEFVPFWGMKVFLVYAPRRVECTRCGVRVEEMPWAEGKHPVTQAYAWFLASWAKRLSWKEVAEVFQSSWDVVFGAVEMAVAYGREHLDLSEIQSLGIDEIAWGRGHRYLTVVYQIDAHCKRLLWVGEKRTIKILLTFFHWLGSERSAALRFICSGSPISRSSPRRRGRPFTFWIASTSWGTSARPSMRSVPRKRGRSKPVARSPS
jgi:transposase